MQFLVNTFYSRRKSEVQTVVLPPVSSSEENEAGEIHAVNQSENVGNSEDSGEDRRQKKEHTITKLYFENNCEIGLFKPCRQRN